MKGKNLLVGVGLLAVLVGVTLFIQGRKQPSAKQASAPENKAIVQSGPASPPHPINTETSEVPDYFDERLLQQSWVQYFPLLNLPEKRAKHMKQLRRFL